MLHAGTYIKAVNVHLLVTPLILMLHSITFLGSKCLKIAHPIMKESFSLLFGEWLGCPGWSQYDFTSTYGNPLFLEYFHIQTNICFSERSETSITSKAVCPAAGLSFKKLELLCQCYPLVTVLQQKPFLTVIVQWTKILHYISIKGSQHSTFPLKLH